MNMVNDDTTAEANSKSQVLDKAKAHALAGFAPRGIPANAPGNPMASGNVLPGLIEPGDADYNGQGSDTDYYDDQDVDCDSGDEKVKCDCNSVSKKKTKAFKIAVLTGVAGMFFNSSRRLATMANSLAVTYLGCCAVAGCAIQGQIVRAEARAVGVSDLTPIVARAVEAESTSSVTESVCTNSSSTTYPTPSAPIGAATINGAVASAHNMTTSGVDMTSTTTDMTTTGVDMTATTKDTTTTAESMATAGNGMVTETKDLTTTVSTETT